MQEKESIMVVWCELKIQSLRITVWHHSVSLLMPNSYLCEGIFNPHLTTIKDSYSPDLSIEIFRNITVNLFIASSNNQMKWATTWQNQQSECAPSEDSDQPGHSPSLIRVFAVRLKEAWILSYPLSTQRKLWTDWADAQADLSLPWAHRHLVGFVMSQLK